MYIVTTALPELRLYKRGGSVTERRRRSLYGRLPSGTPCPRVRFAYSLRQLYVVYHLPTPSILTIDHVTSCRLLKYIHSVAIAPRPMTLDLRLFRAAGWQLFALAVDPPILQPAWRGFEAVERLERRIYTQFKEEAKEEGVVSC